MRYDLLASTFSGFSREHGIIVFRPEGHRISLHLSDPRYSFAMVEWSGVNPATTWATANATATWSDVVLATDI